MAEEKEQFVLKLNWKDLTKEEQIEYVDSLHDYLVNWDASSIRQMILTLDETALEITKDLRMINSGNAYTQPYSVVGSEGQRVEFPAICKLKVLNDDKDSKVYDRVMTLVGKVKDFKAVCEMAEAVRPQILKEQPKPDEDLKIDATSNVFEQLQEKHYKRNKSK